MFVIERRASRSTAFRILSRLRPCLRRSSSAPCF